MTTPTPLQLTATRAGSAARRPVIVIGAPRSGTNMLRNVLTRLPGLGTWPCDEVNAIWRHGNVHLQTDEFAPECATPPVRAFIQRAFARIARRRRLVRVVEKTCANSLRVGFVHRVFPHAQFIYIVRDGRDCALSARQRWTAPLDLPYVLRKARYVPPADVPYYALRYAVNQARRLFSTERQLSTWGPRFAGMDDAIERLPLLQVCALQWRRCVDSADAAFARFDPAQVCRTSYEAFVARPVEETLRLCAYLQVQTSSHAAAAITRDVSQRSVGRWRHQMDREALRAVQDLVGETLSRHGYT